MIIDIEYGDENEATKKLLEEFIKKSLHIDVR